jgi:hypothetical protein
MRLFRPSFTTDYRAPPAGYTVSRDGNMSMKP